MAYSHTPTIGKALNHLKAQAIMDEDKILLPLPPEADEDAAMEVYSRFMRHLRHVPNSKPAIKVLSSMQFASDMLGYSDAHLAKILVEQGLRAPRMAFPAEFLAYADKALMREPWDVGGPNEALLELKEYWDAIGEDKFAAFKRSYDLVCEGALCD